MRRWSYFCVSNAGDDGKIRLETLSRDEAVDYAQLIYKNEKHICEIAEVERVDWLRYAADMLVHAPSFGGCNGAD